MAQADLPLVGDRAGQAEGLEALPQGVGDDAGRRVPPAEGGGGAHHVGPGGVVKADALDAAHQGEEVQPGPFAERPGLLQGANIIFPEKGRDPADPAVVVFKSDVRHSHPSYSFLGSRNVTPSSYRP